MDQEDRHSPQVRKGLENFGFVRGLLSGLSFPGILQEEKKGPTVRVHRPFPV